MMENKLPEGWIEIRIDELTTIIAGGTPSTSVREYFDGDIPWITPADLSGYKMKYISSGRKSISKSGLANSSARLLPKGSVLFSSRAPIGYVVIAENELSTNQGFKSLTPNRAFDSSFAYYYLKYIKDFAESQASGTTFKELSGSKMGQLPFLLAPIAEQTRLVAKLDAAFGHLETLKTSLARIPELLKKFRQTVLTQAVMGKLTITDINKWKETTLADVIESKPKNGYSANPVSYETPFKVLTLTATTSGKFSPNHYKYFDEAISNESHFWLQPDDIIIQRGNTIDYVGVSAIYDKSPKEFIYPDLMIKVRANKSIILTKYLYFVLSCSQSRSYLRERATGTTGNMPKINQPTLIGLPVHLPSLEEQQEIVNRVEALFATADALEAQYQSLKAKIDKLPQALLAKAFRGELVPQDPSDEPASVLLEKIKAATATVGKKGRKSGQTALAFMEE